jgi:hypothetical protein
LCGHHSGDFGSSGIVSTIQGQMMKLLILILLADAFNEVIKWLLGDASANYAGLRQAQPDKNVN